MGDPSGIGPEIILKTLAHPQTWNWCRPIVIGAASVFEQTARQLKSPLKIISLKGDHSTVEGQAISKGHVPILDPFTKRLKPFRLGKPAAVPGAASIQCIHTAVELARNHCVDGIVTAPINKEAMHLAGFPYPGHTELLAELTKTKQVGMMLVGGPLKILLVTTHLAIRDVPTQLTSSRVHHAIQLAHLAMTHYFRCAQPHIGIAGLNPHAGEHGLFGNEEQRSITPAIRKAKASGIRVTGPLPADTLFGAAARGKYDVVVAMYHDQGLIPLKVLAFGQCVNITVGLPIIRTSVDHGTAYDIVGKNKADPSSLLKAIQLAATLASHQTHSPKTKTIL
jgi:4-hydroxythreonine-4-phosphate dehydrogenase